MNKLTFAFAITTALFTFGCKKKGGSDTGAAMAKMAEFKDKMCACKDAECAKKVSDDMTKWSTEMGKDGKEPKMTEADQKKATEIGTQLGECMTKAMGAAMGAPAGDPAAAGSAAAPAGDPAAAAAAPSSPEVDAICKKLEELATKEGGEAVKTWEEGLKKDCSKEITEQKTKKGDKAITEFKACLDGAASLTKAMETCKQID